MSVESNIFTKGSICATCLSQDRKLVTVRNSQLCTLFCSEFSLSLIDSICWECHHMVRKMVCFKRKAQKAQALLRFVTNGQNNLMQKYDCLSSLSISRNITSMITDAYSTNNNNVDQKPTMSKRLVKPEPPEDIVMVDKDDLPMNHIDKVKTNAVDVEINNEIMFNKVWVKDEHVNKQVLNDWQPSDATNQIAHNEKQAVMVDKDVLLIYNEEKSKTDAVSSDYVDVGIDNEIMFNKIWFNDEHANKQVPIDKQTSEAKKQTACDEKQASHTEKHVTSVNCQVLTHKKQEPAVKKKMLHTKRKVPGTKKQVLHSKEDTSSYLDKVREKRGDWVVKKPESIYTEKIMTEDEMVEWRKKKQTTKFYTNSISLELCEECMEPLDSLAVRRAHFKRHTETFGDIVCDICTMRASDDREMAVHKRWHYRLLSCRHCDLVWDNVNTLRRHCQEYHNITQTLWDCELCERQFASAEKLRKHERSHNREKCVECGAAILVMNMKGHMLYHTGGVPLLTCPVCGKQYRGKLGLEIHSQTHRKQVDPAAYCVQCQKQYSTVYQYRTHLRCSRKHASDIDFKHKCDTCDARFLYRAVLQQHIKNMHDEGPKYPCDQCGQVYNAECLRRHLRQKHQKKKQAEFICD